MIRKEACELTARDLIQMHRTRFYLPAPYGGPPVLYLTTAQGFMVAIEVADISCFDELRFEDGGRGYVLVSLLLSEFVCLESRNTIELMMEGVDDGEE